MAEARASAWPDDAKLARLLNAIHPALNAHLITVDLESDYTQALDHIQRIATRFEQEPEFKKERDSRKNHTQSTPTYIAPPAPTPTPARDTDGDIEMTTVNRLYGKNTRAPNRPRPSARGAN